VGSCSAMAMVQTEVPARGRGRGASGRSGRRPGRNSYRGCSASTNLSPYPDWWGYWCSNQSWWGGGSQTGSSNAPPLNTNVAKLFAAAASAEQAAMTSPLEKLTQDNLLGTWADSLGNKVHVCATDAYQANLIATLCRPPRPDVHLRIHAEVHGGLRCGNSVLDPIWSSREQLHWVTADGRVSVWVRLQDQDPQDQLDGPKDDAKNSAAEE